MEPGKSKSEVLEVSNLINDNCTTDQLSDYFDQEP